MPRKGINLPDTKLLKINSFSEYRTYLRQLNVVLQGTDGQLPLEN